MILHDCIAACTTSLPALLALSFAQPNNISKFAFPLKENETKNDHIPINIFRSNICSVYNICIQAVIWHEH